MLLPDRLHEQCPGYPANVPDELEAVAAEEAARACGPAEGYAAEEEVFLGVFDGTVAALEEAGIPYVLMGGVASATVGRPRITHDIDVFVRPADARPRPAPAVLDDRRDPVGGRREVTGADESGVYVGARIQEELARRVGELGVEVTLTNAGVFLSGEVATPERREAVAEVVRELVPDGEVHNQIEVMEYPEPDGAEQMETGQL